jgi:hypothetical protein
MGSADQVNVVLLVESANDLLTKGEADSSVVFTPSLDVLVRV